MTLIENCAVDDCQKRELLARIEALEAALKLHAGDTMSLSNELDEWRERALAAEAKGADRIEVLKAALRASCQRVADMDDEREKLEAALRRAYNFLQDKAFTPDSLTHECTKVVEQIEAALAPEQEK
jgi:chromosome segregation ATPase